MLGVRLRVSREKKGYSRRDLSELSGIDQTTIYKIETDKIVNPKITTIEKLANALEINVFYLLGATDDPARKEVNAKIVTVQKPPPLDQVKKTLEEFEKIKSKQGIQKVKSYKVRPYFPIYIDIPLNAGEILFDSIPEPHVRGHINIDFHDQVDYILSVKGDIMAPLVEDGGLVFVRSYEPGLVKDDDAAIFHLKEKKISVVRQVFYHKIDAKIFIGLRSLNPEKTEWYPYMEDSISCQGKVVGCESDPDEIERILGTIEKLT